MTEHEGAARGQTEEILQPLCSTTREKLKTPFAWEHEGRTWACASDGYRLVALPSDAALREDGPDVSKVWPTAAPTETMRVSALLDFVGQPAGEDCGCDNGKCMCWDCAADHACGKCNGTGKVPVIRYGRLLLGGLNLDYLGSILRTAPAGTEEVRVLNEAPEKPFLFRTDDWIGMLMPIKPATEELKTAPVFGAVCPTEVPGRPPAPSTPEEK